MTSFLPAERVFRGATRVLSGRAKPQYSMVDTRGLEPRYIHNFLRRPIRPHWFHTHLPPTRTRKATVGIYLHIAVFTFIVIIYLPPREELPWCLL